MMRFPPGRKQQRVWMASEAFVQKQDDTLIGFGTNDAAGSLQNAIHAGIGVGKIETGVPTRLPVFPNQIAFQAKLRQSDANYCDADQALTHQIDSLPKNTAEDREWWVHSGATGTVLHAFVIPEKWRKWGVIRGTVVRSAGHGGADGRGLDDRESNRPSDEGEPRFAAGYTLLNMTRLKEAGRYDLMMASIVLPGGYSPGAETGAMAMLQAPLAVEVRRIR